MLYGIRVCVAKPRDLAVEFLVFALMLCVVRPAIGQSNAATLNGTVTDSSGAVIPQAAITLENTATGTARTGVTNGSGSFTMPALDPGSYALRVEKQGFAISEVKDIILHTADNVALVVKLKVGSLNTAVTVSAASLTTDSPGISMTVTREFIENMPLNGRSFQDLIQLAPGTVSNGAYYSVNGQRADSNNYTVDGVSANLGGINNGAGSDNGLSGNTPSQTVLNTTQSMASIDSLQEFRIQTSSYTAEYGRTPGGQIQFTTRSGANDIHGGLFDYFRNTALDANSYYNNYYGSPRTAEHQNDFGGTIGGPFIVPKLYSGKDKTFYFFSYEGLRLLLPSSETEYVPTQAFRNWASPYAQPYLNASPLPNPNSPGNQDGCTVPDPGTGQPAACDALFYYGYSYPNQLDNISLRVDHNLGVRLHAFVRYSDTPSSNSNGAEGVYTSTINTHTWTTGLTAEITKMLLNDLRFNFSHDGEGQVGTQRSVGGSAPLPRNLVIPSAYDSPYSASYYEVYVPNTDLSTSGNYGGDGTVQHQYQIVNSLVWTRGKHGVKFGIDWRRLSPQYTVVPYNSVIEFLSLPDIQQGYASQVFVNAGAPGQPVFDNLSVYAQDHWKVNSRLSLDYGLRWEFNPPPGPSNGRYPVTLTSGNLAIAQLAPPGTPPYKTFYDHFAPRFGFAWNAIASQEHSLTVRGGAGIFYDTGQSAIGVAYSGAYPFTVSGPIENEVPLPLSSAALAPPSLNVPLTPPYPYLRGVSNPNLTNPYTEQWSLSLDQALSAKNTMTLSYVGNNGRKLLFTVDYSGPPAGNPDFAGGLTLTSNASQSSYNALQIQDTGRLANGLDLVASFTYAHALDNASNDNSSYTPQWGNSSNDIRRMLNLALNYQTPAAGWNYWTQALTHGWLVANRFSTQSGYPITDLYQDAVLLPNETYAYYYPDLVDGVPIYLHGRAADANGKPVPGGWRLNRAAFAPVPTDANGNPVRQGTLGRNYVRLPSFWALNTALQRSFPVYEQFHIIFRAEAFNILNHPNLNNPDLSLSSSAFGQLTGGSTTTIGTNNQLYGMGAARSLQLALRLQF